jgi:hypothetical protein
VNSVQARLGREIVAALATTSIILPAGQTLAQIETVRFIVIACELEEDLASGRIEIFNIPEDAVVLGFCLRERCHDYNVVLVPVLSSARGVHIYLPGETELELHATSRKECRESQ